MPFSVSHRSGTHIFPEINYVFLCFYITKLYEVVIEPFNIGFDAIFNSL